MDKINGYLKQWSKEKGNVKLMVIILSDLEKDFDESEFLKNLESEEKFEFPKEYKKNHGIILHVMDSEKSTGAASFSTNLNFLSKPEYFGNIRNNIKEFENHLKNSIK